jgi:hypothetical protein
MPSSNYVEMMFVQQVGSIDDTAGFINNIIGSVFKLSSSNLNLLGLLVRQDESLYKTNAQMRTKKGYHCIVYQPLDTLDSKKGKFNQF